MFRRLLVSNRQLQKWLTGICSPTLRKIPGFSAHFGDGGFLNGNLLCCWFAIPLRKSLPFPVSQLSLSEKRGCVIFFVKHFEIHQCKTSGESWGLLLRIFAIPSCSIYLGSAPSTLAYLIFYSRGRTDLDSHQAKFSIDDTDFLLNYCSITFFMGMNKVSENLFGLLGHLPSSCCNTTPPLLCSFSN